jgi:anti-anti-sigma factor
MVLDSPRLASEACSQLGRLKVRTGREGGTQVVRLIGELDLATVAGLDDELRRVERADPAVIAIDLSELTFIGSAGIGAILEASQRSSERGYRLVVVSANPTVQRAFDICGLTDGLRFVATLPADAAGRSTVTISRRGNTQRLRRPTPAAVRRRSDAAALAAAVRELRTHRRRSIFG